MIDKRSLLSIALLALTLSGGLVLPVPAQDSPASSSIGASPASASDSSTASTAPTADQIAEGNQAWDSGGCANCHGAKGQGGTSLDFPKGPSIRTSGLDHDTLVAIISCGIPGTRMPAWLKGAYTETACNGAPIGPAPSGTTVTGIFTPEQLEALVAYITTTIEVPQ